MKPEKDQIVKIISDKKAYLSRKYALTRIGIYGSVARGEATDKSDIDIIVEMKPDLFKRAALQQELEDILKSSVDVTRYSERMNPALKKRIDREALYV
jgi:predicted nucleotidyltransferase